MCRDGHDSVLAPGAHFPAVSGVGDMGGLVVDAELNPLLSSAALHSQADSRCGRGPAYEVTNHLVQQGSEGRDGKPAVVPVVDPTFM